MSEDCPNLAMTCRICESKHNNGTFTTREMMFGIRDVFDYFECESCGCVQIKNVPENLGKYYPSGYYSFQKAGALKSFLKKQWAFYSYNGCGLIGMLMSLVLGNNQGVESVKRANIPKDVAILDVGCGKGELLLLLESLGFTNLTGADPFLAGDVVYDNGVRVWKREISEISDNFDVVMCHHSLEHMTNPSIALTHVSRVLNPGGLLILRLPIAGTYAWKTYGTNWVQLDPPRHIFLPTIQSMETLAKRVGLKLGQTIYESNEFQFWGSEQYIQDIPLRDPRSLASLPRQVLAHFKLRKYRARAAELNAKGQGDSACFYLQKP
jgi:SAM-dependent methyltransferase